MPAKNPDLHGNVPDTADTALLLIDVINDLEFEGGEALLTHALPAAGRIAALKRRAKAASIPAIYVNDNYGRWQSDFRTLVDHCLHDGVRGRPIADLLVPAAGPGRGVTGVASGAKARDHGPPSVTCAIVRRPCSCNHAVIQAGGAERRRLEIGVATGTGDRYRYVWSPE
jgi:hypothetical protein